MEKFNKQHGENIRLIFEEKTGVDLNPAHRPVPKRGWKAAYGLVMMILVLTMVSCASALFSPLQGDSLALSGHYAGSGVVEVTVTNGSDKALCLQEKVKLVSWHTGEEEAASDGKVSFDGNTDIAPHSSETIRIDLSGAYDIAHLEQQMNPRYYLLLTNQDFLFGQDWMCSFTFREEESEITEPTEQTHVPFSVEPEILENIEPELRHYFEDSYQDELPALTPAHFTYQDQVRELLMRSAGRFVQPRDPWLKPGDVPEDVVFDETVPEQWRDCMVVNRYASMDGYSRMVGSSFGGVGSDFALAVEALVPIEPDRYNTGAYLPLVYFFTYLKSDIQSEEDYAFIYGQKLTFQQLEPHKVFENELYVVYEVTDLFYRDLDGYLDDFQRMREDVCLDDTVRRRLHKICDYYRDKEVLADQFVYYEVSGGAAPAVPAVP